MREIPLTQGMVALVDDEDYESVNEYKWCAWHDDARTRVWYAVSWVDGRLTKMHQLILNRPIGRDIDHRNSNGLDNRRANLRLCTRSQNLANMEKRRGNTSSRYKGVNFHKHTGKWRAEIGSGSGKYIGVFATEEDAARAYNEAARKLWGEFALLNEVD